MAISARILSSRDDVLSFIGCFVFVGYHFFEPNSIMRILYITRANLCLRRAHSHNILATSALLGSISGVDISVISSGKQTCLPEELFMRHDIQIKVPYTRSHWLSGFIFRSRNNFDALYVRDPRLIIEMILARMLGKKVIFEIHGSREWKGLSWLWRFAHRIAHAHIFITTLLKKYYGACQKPCAIIPTVGIDQEKYDNAKSRRIFEQGFVALYLGSQESYYDVAILVRMLARAPKQVVLVLVGIKDDGARDLKKIADELNVSDRVKIIARIDPSEIPAYLKGADVLLNPKVKGFEGSVSSKLIEYLAASRPIVASVVPADHEVLTEKNAIIVNPDPEAFASAIRGLIENSKKREELSGFAHTDAERYSNERRRALLEEFIKKI